MQGKHNWNLDLIPYSHKNFDEFQKEANAFADRFVSKWSQDKSYLTDSSKLLLACKDIEKWSQKYAGGGSFAYNIYLKISLDQTNPELIAEKNKITTISRITTVKLQFFELELSKISKQQQQIFLNDKILKKYHYYLKRIFDAGKYNLSKDAEKVMTMISPVAYDNWIHMLDKFLSKATAKIYTKDGTLKKHNFSEIIGLINNQNKKIRDKAAKAFNKILIKNLDVAENEINSILQYKQINDQLRKIEKPEFSRHITDDIDTNIVETMINSVTKTNNLAKRFYKLKAQLLRVNKLEYHERNVPVGNINQQYTYQQSLTLVKQVFTNLDPEFAKILQNFIDNGQIDAYPKDGKASGAFCIHYLHSHPTYVLLNHNNQLNDVRTLAHEMGHAINNELIKSKQPAIYFGTPTSTAEVASTFMEDFVIQELIKNVDDNQRLNLIMSKLNDDISSIHRQVAFYKFEQELHQQFRKLGYLSSSQIGKIFQKYMKSYMGNSVNQSPGSENWWIYVGHFRRYFYVYSYASGLLISKSLQAKVKNNPKFIKKIKNFLATGESKSPKDIFMDMGIDITDEKFWNQGLKEIEGLLNQAEKLASILK